MQIIENFKNMTNKERLRVVSQYLAVPLVAYLLTFNHADNTSVKASEFPTLTPTATLAENEPTPTETATLEPGGTIPIEPGGTIPTPPSDIPTGPTPFEPPIQPTNTPYPLENFMQVRVVDDDGNVGEVPVHVYTENPYRDFTDRVRPEEIAADQDVQGAFSTVFFDGSASLETIGDNTADSATFEVAINGGYTAEELTLSTDTPALSTLLIVTTSIEAAAANQQVLPPTGSTVEYIAEASADGLSVTDVTNNTSLSVTDLDQGGSIFLDNTPPGVTAAARNSMPSSITIDTSSQDNDGIGIELHAGGKTRNLNVPAETLTAINGTISLDPEQLMQINVITYDSNGDGKPDLEVTQNGVVTFKPSASGTVYLPIVRK
mgnify:CR=1 FL=1